MKKLCDILARFLKYAFIISCKYYMVCNMCKTCRLPVLPEHLRINEALMKFSLSLSLSALNGISIQDSRRFHIWRFVTKK